MKATTLLPSLSLLIHSTTAATPCPPLGPILPHATGPLSSNTAIKHAVENLTSTITHLLAPDVNATSIAVQVSWLGDAHRPLFELYHTAPTVNRTGSREVTPQTQFRLGSVTKVVTVLAMLQHEDRFDWRTPVSVYVPELLGHNGSSDDGLSRVQWDEVTLDSLASQLGGIPRDIQDLALLYDFPWADLGFPSLNNTKLPPCGVASDLPPCNATEYINALTARRPAYAPYTTPVYSNAAYALLGLALERILQQDYATIIKDNILGPLGMENSSIDTPYAEQVLIPAGDSQWDIDDGFLRPTGQLYSSITDLSTLGLSILNSTLLTPVQTNHWLKPRTHTSSLTASVGAPWEIYRTNTLTPDGRVIDVYTKDGGIGEYGSYLVLVPDYGVAVTFLTAGANRLFSEVPEAALRAIIPAIDSVARDQAEKNYVGVYKDQHGSSNMSISMTDAGLRVEQLFNNGKDILAEYANLFQPFELGLYPSGLHSATASHGKGSKSCQKATSEESWRGVYNFIQYPYDGFLSQCSSWAGIDGNVYGQQALDQFVFGKDAEGAVWSVRNSALRTVLYKQ